MQNTRMNNNQIEFRIIASNCVPRVVLAISTVFQRDFRTVSLTWPWNIKGAWSHTKTDEFPNQSLHATLFHELVIIVILDEYQSHYTNSIRGARQTFFCFSPIIRRRHITTYTYLHNDVAALALNSKGIFLGFQSASVVYGFNLFFPNKSNCRYSFTRLY